MSKESTEITVVIDGAELDVQDEHKVRDVSLARRLDYGEPRAIRKLIKRLEAEGRLGTVDWRDTVSRLENAGNLPPTRRVREAWLTQAQACKVIAKSETDKADAALDWIIAVFVAAQRGRGGEAVALATGQIAPRALAADLAYEVIDITPQIAHDWLQHRNERNRNISDSVVRKYAADMKLGLWTLTHQGIAFGPGGELIDGQHRLSAIVMSGATIRMVVNHYGSTEGGANAKLKTDVGLIRRVGHVLEFGAVVSRGSGQDIAALVTAIGTLMGVGSHSMSVEQVSATYLANREAIDWAHHSLPRREWSAAVRAAFAYAYPVDPAAIRSFAEIAIAKVGHKPETPVHVFIRAECTHQLKVRGGKTDRRHVMLKVLRILKAHLRNEKGGLSKLYVTKEGLEYMRHRRATQGIDAQIMLPLAAE